MRINKFCKKLTFVVFISTSLIVNAQMHCPASNEVLKIKQKNGTTLSVVGKGDKTIHYTETNDGYSILRNRKGIYEYAKKGEKNSLELSGIKVSSIENRTMIENKFLETISKNLKYSSSQISSLIQNSNNAIAAKMINDGELSMLKW